MRQQRRHISLRNHKRYIFQVVPLHRMESRHGRCELSVQNPMSTWYLFPQRSLNDCRHLEVKRSCANRCANPRPVSAHTDWIYFAITLDRGKTSLSHESRMNLVWISLPRFRIRLSEGRWPSRTLICGLEMALGFQLNSHVVDIICHSTRFAHPDLM